MSGTGSVQKLLVGKFLGILKIINRLAPDIVQCPAKTLMSDESNFTTDAVVRREVNFFIRYRPLKTQKHSVSIDLSRLIFLFINKLIDNLLNPLQPGVAFLYPLKASENL